jgi:hypothetical protein
MASTDRAQRPRLGRNQRVVARYDKTLPRDTKRIYQFLAETDEQKTSLSDDYSFACYQLWHLQYYDKAGIDEEGMNGPPNSSKTSKYFANLEDGSMKYFGQDYLQIKTSILDLHGNFWSLYKHLFNGSCFPAPRFFTLQLVITDTN